MSPTIVLQDGKPVLALGSPGGSTIITTVLQILVNRLDLGHDARRRRSRRPRVSPRNTRDGAAPSRRSSTCTAPR